MTYTTAEARQQILDSLAGAVERIGVAVASLGEAYEQLDEQTADRLEEQLFRPTQRAYGRAKRTHSEFAARHELPAATFQSDPPGAPSTGAKGFVNDAVESVREAEQAIAALQDSMLPVEVGDPELRAGLAEIRELLGDVPHQAREFVRILGR